MEAEQAAAGGTVLVVEDEARGRQLLREILEERGYKVVEASGGQEALQLIGGSEGPDVVLLDILLPDLDGFHVCRAIRKDLRSAHIPVIMLTALKDRASRIQGIREGADDFLTKPVDAEEVVLRVRNAARAKALFDAVQDDYKQLRELEQMRDKLAHMIVHDMNQPLTAMGGYLEYLRSVLKPGESAQILNAMNNITRKLGTMVQTILDIQKMEEGKVQLSLQPTDVPRVVDTTIERMYLDAFRHCPLERSFPPDSTNAICDPDVIQRVVMNLLDNAFKYTPVEGKVAVRIERQSADVRVEVSDNGPGIPAEFHDRIFQKFGFLNVPTHTHRQSTGLGLAFCKLAIEAHRGKIGFISQAGAGTTFWFALPVAR